MHTEVLMTLIFLFLLLILLLFIKFFAKDPKRALKTENQSALPTHPCPLCEKKLQRGERVHSQVFTQKDDKLMNIYGCPYCYPAHPKKMSQPLRDKKCPSCKLPLKAEAFVIARVFERENKKTHVHILGCSTCRHRKDWI